MAVTFRSRSAFKNSNKYGLRFKLHVPGALYFLYYLGNSMDTDEVVLETIAGQSPDPDKKLFPTFSVRVEPSKC